MAKPLCHLLMKVNYVIRGNFYALLCLLTLFAQISEFTVVYQRYQIFVAIHIFVSFLRFLHIKLSRNPIESYSNIQDDLEDIDERVDQSVET